PAWEARRKVVQNVPRDEILRLKDAFELRFLNSHKYKRLTVKVTDPYNGLPWAKGHSNATFWKFLHEIYGVLPPTVAGPWDSRTKLCKTAILLIPLLPVNPTEEWNDHRTNLQALVNGGPRPNGDPVTNHLKTRLYKYINANRSTLQTPAAGLNRADILRLVAYLRLHCMLELQDQGAGNAEAEAGHSLQVVETLDPPEGFRPNLANPRAPRLARTAREDPFDDEDDITFGIFNEDPAVPVELGDLTYADATAGDVDDEGNDGQPQREDDVGNVSGNVGNAEFDAAYRNASDASTPGVIDP
ncbi:hypothetical protein HK104_003060, partial [Borealophlyctis nickersoniae]